MKGTYPFGQVPFFISKYAFDVLEIEMPQNVRYFANLFGGSAFYLYLCRRICNVMTVVLSHKV